MRGYVGFLTAAVVIGGCVSAQALTGSGESASVALETVSPTLQSLSALTDTSLSATFSEPMLAPDITTPINYVASGLGAGTLSMNPDGISGGPSAYLLDWVSGEMRDGVALTLTVAGVRDAMGNPINPALNSASCAGLGTAPVFSDLMVTPSKASTGESVSISFLVSEPLAESPEVTVNGHVASEPAGKAEGYLFEYEVQGDDPLGMALIEVSGADLAGNVGMLSDNAMLEIVETEPGLPLWGWPLAAALLMLLGIIFLVRKRLTLECGSPASAFSSGHLYAPDGNDSSRRQAIQKGESASMACAVQKGHINVEAASSRFINAARMPRLHWFLFLAVLAASSAIAQTPIVSNVTMTQSPNAISTQVDIYYDLDAPNGPCAITVSLSKDGGADGYNHPVISVTGDLADVATGTGKHIVWDIRADYPEEDLPNARIRVTAEDGLPDIGTFAINGGADTTADPVVTLDNTATNSPTEYMASESSDFNGASWQPYDTAPAFTLSAAEGGTKTVYFKVRNAAGESAPVSDTIDLTGQTITLPGDVPLELVWVPGGTFMMGRYPGEQDSFDWEDPQHPVTLAYGFWMGKYEITQRQWLAVRGSWPGEAPSLGVGDSYPAYSLSWNDAKDFITSLNAQIASSGQGPLTVRLPSEAEWEYACRAGTTTRFYFGDAPGCDGFCSDCAAGTLPGNVSNYLWYCGNDSPGGAKPVGGKLPNAFGLYDMHGNIHEWCEDDSHYDYLGAPSDGSAWVESPRTEYRMLKGSSYADAIMYCRASCRSHYPADWRESMIGFRLAAVAPPEVVSFAINEGAESTTDPVVTLDNVATNSPTEYMASEASDFSGASWQPYATAPTLNLSFGVGTRTVYFKVRNAGREVSNVVSDMIFLAPNTVSVATETFSMGRPYDWDSPWGTQRTDELPVHSVTLGTYQLGKGEVTNKEYCDVLNWALAQGYLYADAAGTPWPGSGDIYAGGTAGSRYLAVYFTSMYCDIQYSDGVFISKTRVGLPDTTNYSMDTHPMVRVTWYGAAAFCNWLSEWQGLTPCYDMNTEFWPLTVAPPTPGGYRLPTEAEWERAAAWESVGGGKHWVYGFLSDTNLSGTADRCNDRNEGAYDNPLGLTALPFTSPVGWFDGVNVSPNGSVQTVDSPSPVGAYDMSGNVMEWCHDWYSLTHYSNGAMANPTGPATGTYRVNRGGGWGDNFYSLRSALRNFYTPTSAGATVGFRLARSEPSVGVSSFAINNGDESTALPTVTLDNTCWGTPTEYIASESSDFSGAAWQPYDTAPTFTLSLGEGGTKTVYFKVRNEEYESVPASDTIELPWRTIMLPGDVPLELVWVPSGSFQMGRYPGEPDSYDNEDPQHLVMLAYGFWMGKYEVTQQQWLAVRGSWPGTAPSVSNGLGDTCPAYFVSWDDAKEFIVSLNVHLASSGQGPLTVRLPSEAEREYACRAGTSTRYYFGDSLGCTVDCADCAAGTLPGNRTDYMWYCGNNSPSGSKPVGGTLPNAFGLYDMSGNVCEWCEDDYHDNYTDAPEDGIAWIDAPRASARIFRGGDWGTYAQWCRSGDRNGYPATGRDYSIGFRLAAVPVQVVSFAINGGAVTTADPTVTLDNTAAGSPTEYMASEAPDFGGATWQPYAIAPSFTLSSSEGGTKTVYFKVRNAGGESTIISDTIELVGRTITLPGDVPLELVWVPAGSFQMGRYPGEAESADNEDPQHPVTLAYGLWMGKYETTQQQWLAVRGSWPQIAPSATYGIGDRNPAYFISWNDAKNFITTLNAHIVSSGQGPLTVRLPSEAEWEYACRAGTQTRFYWGDDLTYTEIGTYAWYSGNNSPSGTKPVGGKLPNLFGLCDMSGNVSEWCEDDHHYSGYTGAPADGSAWIDSPRDDSRVFRGGPYAGLYHCRSAFRFAGVATARTYNIGFRLAGAPTRVLSLAINGGAATTTELLVTLDNTATNSPTEYMASEAPDFSGATWQPYATAPSFTLSYGVGARTVYFKVRDAGGEVFNVVSDTIFVTPTTVSVATGTFTMGRLDSGTNDDVTYGATYEIPRHEVTLGAYQLGKYEVTNKEYCDVLNWAKAKGYLYADAAGTPWTGSTSNIYGGGTAASRYRLFSFFDIEYVGGLFVSRTRVGLPDTTNYSMNKHPMGGLSWYGAAAFCNWLSEWQGLTPCYDMNSPDWPLTVAPPAPGGYRLPTEAEWERAAGWDPAGGGRHWVYGFLSDTLTGNDRANYTTVNPLGLSAVRTSPVGWFNGVNVSPNGSVQTVDSPSPVGAYDMSGNAQEWCQDWFSATYYSDGPTTNPTGPATGSNRMTRGGNCSNPFNWCRSACRVSFVPTTANSYNGFRLARTE